ncbi:Hypp2539 [Branchiostoma lanceolatum]|uniref:Hypp2539 protein n=1 Tax=Branchiostoma lanceolatum TaxID=7740 RepID=A0A8J9ZUD6_BRALA|nr:Hypp2539 [Branchiostoma lanceolatum]
MHSVKYFGQEMMVHMFVHSDFFCCGTDYINSTTDKCCTTKYHHKHPTPYKFDHHMCCSTQHDITISDWMLTVDIAEKTCCGLETMYKRDPEHMCCKDKIVKRTVGQACCADHGLFEESTHVCCQGNKTVKRSECCQGQVHSPEEGRTACCAGTAYNPDTHSCCQDTVVNGTGQCCGKTVMDPNMDSCCQDTVEENASVPQTSPNHGCCGFHSMNNQTHTCCAGMAVPKDVGRACCGKATYHKESELCCGPNHDMIQTKVTNKTQCCGSGTYESGEENCCVGRRTSIMIPAGRECCRTEDGEYQDYDPNNATCCGSQVHDGIPKSKKMCCGETMRTDQQLCCEDNYKDYKVLAKMGQGDNKCCLNHDTNDILPYNSKDKVCLHGELSFIHHGQLLCGSMYYNPGEKLCCSGVLHSKKEEPDRRCCGRGVQAYSPSYQSCCQGRVKADPEHIWGCCKGKFYHKNKHDCPGPHETLVSLLADGEAPTPPPPGIQTSPAEETINCAGKKFGRWSEDGREKRCCNERLSARTYFPQNQTCCRSRVFDLPDEIASCCRGVAYDNTTHCCINGKVQNCTDQPTPTPPHTKEQISCMGYKHDRYDEQGKERLCCGRGTNSYTPATQTCCGNKVANIPSSIAGCCRGRPYSKDRYRCRRGQLIPWPQSQPSSPPTEPVETISPQQPDDEGYTPSSTPLPPTTTTTPTTTKTSATTTPTTTTPTSTPTPSWKPNYPECGGKEYDPTAYICYKNKTFFKDKYDLCDGNLYITTKKKCCAGRIRKLRKHKTECCGKWLVNPRRVDCTDNKPVKRTGTRRLRVRTNVTPSSSAG